MARGSVYRSHRAVTPQSPVEGDDEALEPPGVAVMLHFEVVPWAVDVADPTGAGDAVAGARALAREEGLRPRAPLVRQRHPRHELPLEIGQTPLAAVGLEEPADGDVIAGTVKGVEEESRVAVFRIEALRRDERQVEPLAGGGDHDVEALAGPIRERHLVAVEATDVAARHDRS